MIEETKVRAAGQERTVTWATSEQKDRRASLVKMVFKASKAMKAYKECQATEARRVSQVGTAEMAYKAARAGKEIRDRKVKMATRTPGLMRLSLKWSNSRSRNTGPFLMDQKAVLPEPPTSTESVNVNISCPSGRGPTPLRLRSKQTLGTSLPTNSALRRVLLFLTVQNRPTKEEPKLTFDSMQTSSESRKSIDFA